MQNITSLDELKEAINVLEAQQQLQGKLLKDEFKVFTNQFRPVNIIKSVLMDVRQSPDLLNYIIDTSLGIGIGTLSKKIFTRFSSGPFKTVIGTVLKYGVSNIIMNHSGPIKTLGNKIFGRFFKKNKAILSGM